MNNNDFWWSAASPDAFVDSHALIALWEKELLALAGQQNLEFERERVLQSLGDLSKTLWQAFNTDRSSLDRDYMATEKLLSAYLSAFFIPNIERSRYILNQRSTSKILSEILKNEHLRILDFGAGPLSSTFGLLIALGEISTQLKKTLRPQKITIVAVERSEKSVRIAEKWIKQCINPNIQVEIERCTSVPTDRVFNIVLASNVFNEIPLKHHLKTFNMLRKCLATESDDTNSLLLIVEPGQEVHSRNLVALRDQIVAEKNGLHLIGPCPHTAPCPLGAEMKRTDWCWFRRTFKAPPLQLELDQRTQIDHQELAFSYLAFAQHQTTPQHKPWAVCVSDPIPMGDAEGQQRRQIYFQKNRLSESATPSDERIAHLALNGAKTKLCSQTGELIAGISEGIAAPLRHRRGDEIQAGKEFELLIRER